MKAFVAFFLLAVLVVVQISQGLPSKSDFQEVEAEDEVEKPAARAVRGRCQEWQVWQGLSLEADDSQGIRVDGQDKIAGPARARRCVCQEWKCSRHCRNSGYPIGYCYRNQCYCV